MKKLFLFLVLSLSIQSFSQEALKLTFNVSFIADSVVNVVNGKTMYLCTTDSVTDNRMLRDGRAYFVIEKDKLDECMIAIRQDDESLLRIKLKAFLEFGEPVVTPYMKVSIDDIESVNANYGYKKDEIKKPNVYHRFVNQNSFTKESQLKQYGVLRWYFPSELFMNKDSCYDNYLSKWFNEERYLRVYGEYPKDGLIDSVKDSLLEKRAECYAGWYSDRLIQLKEPILCNGYPRDVYRFTWSSNEVYYIYDPYCMRIELDDEGNAIMYCSYLRWDDCEDYILYCDIVPLQKSEITEMLSLLKRTNMDRVKPLLDNGGSNNILEANINGKYHVIFRGDGEDEGLEELREFLWKLTGLGENKIVHKRQRIE